MVPKFSIWWWTLPRGTMYSMARKEEEEVSMFLAAEEDMLGKTSPYRQSSYQIWLWSFFCLVTFIAGAIMLGLSLSSSVLDMRCTMQLGIWSPIVTSIKYEVRDFTAALSQEQDPYIGPPTPELELAWRKLQDMPAVLIPETRLSSLHRNASQNFVKSQTPGKPGYIATIEVFHHLHCLDIIRQFVYRDSYPTNLVPWLLEHNTPEVARKHVNHCFGTLREALMCNADLTPYLWYEGENGTVAKEDFQAAHKCKIWESVIESVMDNSVEIPRGALQGNEHRLRSKEVR